MTINRFLICLAIALAPLPVSAGMISFNGTGIPSGGSLPVNVSATFTNVGSAIEVDLFNSSTGTDPLQILSGIVWDVTGTAPTGTSLTAGHTGSGSDLYTSGTSGTPNSELRNSVLGGGDGWQYLAPPGQLNSTAYQFGLGASGLNGTFGGLGNASYGAIGPSSNIGHVPLSNQLPLVMSTTSSPSEAVFVISNFTLDVSHIKNVTFAFGSAGTNNVVGFPSPEPTTFVLAAMGFVGFAAWGWRRRTPRAS